MPLQTSDVFTPAKLPTVTDVTRADLSKQLDRQLRRGGYFVSVLGTTKLGKTTLVKSSLRKIDYSIFLRGQSLNQDDDVIWQKLAAELGIPSSKEKGTVSGDKSTWGFFGKFAASLALIGKAEAGAQIGGEHSVGKTTNASVPLDAESEVIKAFELLIESGMKVAIAIDDFHFITDTEKRRSLIKALRPVAAAGVSIILITLPNRQTDPAFSGTNIGGRHWVVYVKPWGEDDLRRIALQGFEALNLTTTIVTINRLVKESFGSPQIMQQLCLDLCEDVNDVLSKVPGNEPQVLGDPAWWLDFFKAVKDFDSAEWLTTLGLGPKKKRDKRTKYDYAGMKVDGYQLILLAIRDLGVPVSVPFQDIKVHIGAALKMDANKVNQMALEAKAKNMHVLAHKVVDEKIAQYSSIAVSAQDDDVFSDEDLEIAGDIPQPVFEFTTNSPIPQINVLDPLLAYTLKWHSDSFLS